MFVKKKPARRELPDEAGYSETNIMKEIALPVTAADSRARSRIILASLPYRHKKNPGLPAKHAGKSGFPWTFCPGVLQHCCRKIEIGPVR